jgi:hypothetical protein
MYGLLDVSSRISIVIVVLSLSCAHTSFGCCKGILYQMVYGKTPFADCQGVHRKAFAITNPNYVIEFPGDVDEAAIDAMKLCLERNPKLRGTIVGDNGLLTQHVFLHSRSRR